VSVKVAGPSSYVFNWISRRVLLGSEAARRLFRKANKLLLYSFAKTISTAKGLSEGPSVRSGMSSTIATKAGISPVFMVQTINFVMSRSVDLKPLRESHSERAIPAATSISHNAQAFSHTMTVHWILPLCELGLMFHPRYTEPE